MTRVSRAVFHDVDDDGVELIDAEEPADLAEESFDEAEVAAGDAGDRQGCFTVGR